MAVIAEGPCAVTSETFKAFHGKAVYFGSDARDGHRYRTTYRVISKNNGVYLHVVLHDEYLHLLSGNRFHVLKGQRFSTD